MVSATIKLICFILYYSVSCIYNRPLFFLLDGSLESDQDDLATDSTSANTPIKTPPAKSKSNNVNTSSNGKVKNTKSQSNPTTQDKTPDPAPGRQAAPPPVQAATVPQAKAILTEYLRRTNRPYNGVNIVDNLRGAVNKAFAVTALEELAAEEVSPVIK